MKHLYFRRTRPGFGRCEDRTEKFTEAWLIGTDGMVGAPLILAPHNEPLYRRPGQLSLRPADVCRFDRSRCRGKTVSDCESSRFIGLQDGSFARARRRRLARLPLERGRALDRSVCVVQLPNVLYAAVVDPISSTGGAPQHSEISLLVEGLELPGRKQLLNKRRPRATGVSPAPISDIAPPAQRAWVRSGQHV